MKIIFKSLALFLCIALVATSLPADALALRGMAYKYALERSEEIQSPLVAPAPSASQELITSHHFKMFVTAPAILLAAIAAITAVALYPIAVVVVISILALAQFTNINNLKTLTTPIGMLKSLIKAIKQKPRFVATHYGHPELIKLKDLHLSEELLAELKGRDSVAPVGKWPKGPVQIFPELDKLTELYGHTKLFTLKDILDLNVATHYGHPELIKLTDLNLSEEWLADLKGRDNTAHKQTEDSKDIKPADHAESARPDELREDLLKKPDNKNEPPAKNASDSVVTDDNIIQDAAYTNVEIAPYAVSITDEMSNPAASVDGIGWFVQDKKAWLKDIIKDIDPTIFNHAFSIATRLEVPQDRHEAAAFFYAPVIAALKNEGLSVPGWQKFNEIYEGLNEQSAADIVLEPNFPHKIVQWFKASHAGSIANNMQCAQAQIERAA